MESGFLLLRTAGAFALVLGLLFGCLFLIRRWGNFTQKPASKSAMEVLCKQSFGPKHHLVLVEITGEQKILVGISPQNMSLLPVSPALHTEEAERGEQVIKTA